MRRLQADTYYRIELRAQNAIGFSTSATLLLKTARGESISKNFYQAGFHNGYRANNASQMIVHQFYSLFLLSCVFVTFVFAK